MKLHVRWMIRRDMPEVLDIESSVFEHAWTEEDFIKCLRQRNCIGMVAEDEDNGRVRGYFIYEMHTNRIHLLNFAVEKAVHRRGVGRRMMQKIQLKLSSQRRTRVLCEVRESNVDAQLFLKAMGFKAVSVLREFYDEHDVSEDAYVMQYRHRPEELGASTQADSIVQP